MLLSKWDSLFYLTIFFIFSLFLCLLWIVLFRQLHCIFTKLSSLLSKLSSFLTYNIKISLPFGMLRQLKLWQLTWTLSSNSHCPTDTLSELFLCFYFSQLSFNFSQMLFSFFFKFLFNPSVPFVERHTLLFNLFEHRNWLHQFTICNVFNFFCMLHLYWENC